MGGRPRAITLPPSAHSRPTGASGRCPGAEEGGGTDRKSTRLNSSHDQISYAVFCLKKKKKNHPVIAYVPTEKLNHPHSSRRRGRRISSGRRLAPAQRASQGQAREHSAHAISKLEHLRRW